MPHTEIRNPEISDLVERLRALSRYDHDDLSVGDEAATMIESLYRTLHESARTEKKARRTEYAKPGMTLGKRIKYRREEIGLTQAQLAAAIGKPQSVIQSLENRDSRKTAHLESIAKALDVEPGWLATGVGEMLSTNPPQHKNHDQLSTDKHNVEHSDSPHETIHRLESLYPGRGWKYKSDFYQSYGIGSQVYNNWRKRGIPWRHIFEVSRFMNVSPEWLATGHGDKVVDAAISQYAAKLPDDVHAMLMLALGRESEARIPDDIKPLVHQMLCAITDLIRIEQDRWP